jgi:two-component system, NtrC family, sensor histidine kinase KinB
MKIKTKLSLGLAFLFGVVVLISVLSIIYLNRISNDSKEILKDNYESLEYFHQMNRALESGNLVSFRKTLELQEANVTENGEKELTAQLRVQFEELEKDTASVFKTHGHDIRSTLNSLTEINLQALLRKNEVAQATVKNALTFIGIIGSICFLVTLTFIVNFPGYIANPIQELTAGIKEITNKNYDERLNFKSGDEFGSLADAFNSMAEKLEEFESSSLAQILFEKKRIDTIINKMNDPIIGLDEKKNILFINTEAIKIIGKNSDELIGQYAPDVAVKNDLFRSLIKDLMDNNLFPLESPVLKIFVDGKESYFTKEILRVTIVPTGETKVTSVGFVILLKNVTSFKELDIAKTNFIATVSHELKTPLAAIQMCSKLLQDKRVGDLNEEQSRIVVTVKEETDRLIRITSELLDLAQVETGQLQLEIKQVRPSEIVDYAFNALKFQAEMKHIELERQCPDDLPVVKADLEKTSWVLVNFLTNAIHYSPEYSRVIVRAARKNGKVIFSVQDFGKGIETKHIDHIFDKFYKVPNSTPSGTGLGLAISKDFIKSENGSIWVESDFGKGSTFSFDLEGSVPTTL